MPTPEQRREYDKAYREKHRERIRAREKAWRDANIERVREAARRRYERTKEHYAARQKAWREANRDKANGYTRRWRKRRTDECRLEGVCIGCLKYDAVEGKHRCQKCLDDNKARNELKRAEIAVRLAAGEKVCTRCGKENKSRIYKSCATCRRRSKVYARKSMRPFCGCSQPKEPGREACVACIPDSELEMPPSAREILRTLRIEDVWMSGDALAEELGLRPNSIYVSVRRSLLEFVEVRDNEGHFEYRARR